jgi:cyclohexanecarboxyl-CoA dehydrogenase
VLWGPHAPPPPAGGGGGGGGGGGPPPPPHDAITQCLLLHGQYGYRTELPIEQRMRDVLGLQIGDGTAQIMKLVIARQRVGRELAP